MGDHPAATVGVALGERSYDIVIGPDILATAGAAIRAVMAGPRAVVVSDETVAALHAPALLASLAQAGVDATLVTIRPGEESKSFSGLETLVDLILATRIERAVGIVALGGGVVGDLAGFAAAILLRGLDFVQLPTTLLAQVDSAVGGKTGINTGRGKNLVGSFHQPRLVLCDTRLLATLPRRDLLSGYAEVVKYGAIDDAPFFAWLEANGPAALGGDGAKLAEAVRVSCAAKARIVARDEKETGDRALLNLGHTFAHALETATGYGGRLLHGEAVAIGMVLAFRLSARLGLCAPAEIERLRAHLAGVGLPTRLADIDGPPLRPEALLDTMGRDKKVSAGRLTFILARGIGRSFVARDIEPAAVLATLAEG